MKNKMLAVLAASFAIFTLVFLGLWRTAVKNHESCLRSICESNIEQAKDAFENYSKFKQEKSYWYGVGCFHAFMGTYEQLPKARGDCMAAQGEAYFQMLHKAEECLNDVDPLIDIMHLMSEDYDSFLSERALANLSNLY